MNNITCVSNSTTSNSRWSTFFWSIIHISWKFSYYLLKHISAVFWNIFPLFFWHIFFWFLIHFQWDLQQCNDAHSTMQIPHSTSFLSREGLSTILFHFIFIFSSFHLQQILNILHARRVWFHFISSAVNIQHPPCLVCPSNISLLFHSDFICRKSSLPGECPSTRNVTMSWATAAQVWKRPVPISPFQKM